jgi:hypothetical protein
LFCLWFEVESQKIWSNRYRLSARIVAREIKNLQGLNAIRHIGSDRKGHWEIVKEGTGGGDA